MASSALVVAPRRSGVLINRSKRSLQLFKGTSLQSALIKGALRLCGIDTDSIESELNEVLKELHTITEDVSRWKHDGVTNTSRNATPIDEELSELARCAEGVDSFLRNLAERRSQTLHFYDNEQIRVSLRQYKDKLKEARSRFNSCVSVKTNLAILNPKGEPTPSRNSATVGQPALDSHEVPKYALVPQPGVVVGRKRIRDPVVKALTAPETGNACVALLGPGGIGKTTLALSIAHDEKVVHRFRHRRLFIACDSTNTASDIVTLLVHGLNLRAEEYTSGVCSADSRQAIHALVLSHLQSLNQPMLIIFDNLESAWDTDDKANVEQLLTSLSVIRTVSILVTMRGTQHPYGPKWTRPFHGAVPPLSPDAAKELYRSICETEDHNLSVLLETLDHLPLAVRLMAMLGQGGTTPTHLLDQYRRERTSMLQQREDRTSSLDVSIRISLDCQRMRANPEALQLLRVLSIIPEGLDRSMLEHIFENMNSPGGAATTLLHTSLAYQSGNRIRVLSPIRLFTSQHHPPSAGCLDAVLRHYFAMAAQSSQLGTPAGAKAIRAMASEFANMTAILAAASDSNGYDEDLVQAILSLSQFSLWLCYGACDHLLKGVLNAEDSYHAPLLLRGRCALALGRSLRVQHRLDEGAAFLKQAKMLCQSVGDERGLAESIQYLALSATPTEGQTMLEEAIQLYQKQSDKLGEAQSVAFSASLHVKQGAYADAIELLTRAADLHSEIGHQEGEAHCTLIRAQILVLQGSSEEALTALCKARMLAEAIGSRAYQGVCAYTLGGILLARQSDKALPVLREAQTALQQVNLTSVQAECMNLLGVCLAYQHGDIDEALRVWRDAYERFRLMGNRHGMVENTVLRIAALVFVGRSDEIETLLLDASQLGILATCKPGVQEMYHDTLGDLRGERFPRPGGILAGQGHNMLRREKSRTKSVKREPSLPDKIKISLTAFYR